MEDINILITKKFVCCFVVMGKSAAKYELMPYNSSCLSRTKLRLNMVPMRHVGFRCIVFNDWKALSVVFV